MSTSTPSTVTDTTRTPLVNAVLIPSVLEHVFGKYATSRETAVAVYNAVISAFGTDVEFAFIPILNEDGNETSVDIVVSKLGSSIEDHQLLSTTIAMPSNLTSATLCTCEGELVLTFRILLAVVGNRALPQNEVEIAIEWSSSTTEMALATTNDMHWLSLGLSKSDATIVLKSLANGLYHINNIGTPHILSQPLSRSIVQFEVTPLSMVDFLRHNVATQDILPRLSFTVSTNPLPTHNKLLLSSSSPSPSPLRDSDSLGYNKMRMVYNYQKRPTTLMTTGHKRPRILSLSESMEVHSKRPRTTSQPTTHIVPNILVTTPSTAPK